MRPIDSAAPILVVRAHIPHRGGSIVLDLDIISAEHSFFEPAINFKLAAKTLPATRLKDVYV